MTSGALSAKLALMRIILGVAGGTVLGRTFEQIILMTICASHRCMFPIQMECKFGVIHLRGFPALGSMTSSTLRTQLTLMGIIFGVAGSAILRCAFENAVLMAIFAGHGSMLPIQMECEFRMIHFCILPAFGSMAGRAIGSKLTVMMVDCRVTGDTSLRSRLQICELARIYVAFGTS